MNKFDKYNESINSLVFQKKYRKSLITICKVLLSKYETNEKDYYCFFEFLNLFEKSIYDSLFEKKINEKEKILMELQRLNKNNPKDNDIYELINEVVKGILEKEDINILKTIIVKKQLSNGMFPSFVTTLFEVYNQTMAYLLNKNETKK